MVALGLFQSIRSQLGMVFALLAAETQPERSTMLKVTQTNSHGGAIVKLEGKLLQPWVDEVRALFLPSLPRSLPRLDLASLTFVDAAGADLLRQLLGQGVAIESCSPFVAALLQLNHK
jgi:hypothetical protein